MSYKYELKINGIVIETKEIQFRPNVITEMTEDMIKHINMDMPNEVSFCITKIKK